MSPVPIVFPMITDAAEDAPTAVDFTIKNKVDATLFAAMAVAFICPRITVCNAVLTPQSPWTNSIGAVTLK